MSERVRVGRVGKPHGSHRHGVDLGLVVRRHRERRLELRDRIGVSEHGSEPLGEPELVTDEIVLRCLSRFKRVRTGGEARTGVGHCGAEHHGVEVVAHVVVVPYGLCVSSA